MTWWRSYAQQIVELVNPGGYAARQLIVIKSQHTARGKYDTQTGIPMLAVASDGVVFQD